MKFLKDNVGNDAVNDFIKISHGKTLSVKIEDSLDSHFLSFGGDMTPKIYEMFKNISDETLNQTI